MNALPANALQICENCAAEYDPRYAECCALERGETAIACPGCLTSFGETPAGLLYQATFVAFEIASSNTPSS